MFMDRLRPRWNWSAFLMACFLFLSVFVCSLPARAADAGVVEKKAVCYWLASVSGQASNLKQIYSVPAVTLPGDFGVTPSTNNYVNFQTIFGISSGQVPAGAEFFLTGYVIAQGGSVAPRIYGFSGYNGTGLLSSYYDGFDGNPKREVDLNLTPYNPSGYGGYRFDVHYTSGEPTNGVVTFGYDFTSSPSYIRFHVDRIGYVTTDGQIVNILGDLSSQIADIASTIVSSANSIASSVTANQNANTTTIVNNQNSNTTAIVNNQNTNTNKITANQDANTNKVTANQNANTDKITANQDKNAATLANGWDDGQLSSDNGKLSGALGDLDALQASADSGLNDALSDQTSPDLSDHTESVTFITSSAVLFWNALGPFQIVIYLILSLVVFNFLSRYQSGGK